METKVKLPKQWRHWCADQKLCLHGTKRGQGMWQWFYLKAKATTGESTAMECCSVAMHMRTLIVGRFASSTKFRYPEPEQSSAHRLHD